MDATHVVTLGLVALLIAAGAGASSALDVARAAGHPMPDRVSLRSWLRVCRFGLYRLLISAALAVLRAYALLIWGVTMCPGCQGPLDDPTHFACRGCWQRLPEAYRGAINTAYRRRVDARGSSDEPGARAAHDAAKRGAAQWYRRNPVDAPADPST